MSAEIVLCTLPYGWRWAGLTKYLESIVDYRGATPEKVPSGIFLVTAGNIRDGRIDYDASQEFVREEDYEEIMRRGKPRLGDLLFTTEAPLGQVALVDREDIALAQRVIKMRPKRNELDNQFLLYWMRSVPFQLQLATWATGSTALGIKAEKLHKLHVIIPPFAEQHAIAVYLDRETVRLDGLVAAKERVLGLLAEKRRALITRAVTRGLNPRVPFRNSGIPWLGKIPEHWGTSKFSWSVYIVEGQVDPEVEPYLSMLLVAPNHIEPGTGKLTSRETAAEQAAISGKYLCQTGDVIYSKIRPALRKATLAPEECLCSADMYPLRTRQGLDTEYLLFLLLSEPFSMWAVLESDRVAMPKINREALNDLRLPLPPMSEQRDIVDHITAETAKLDALRAATERTIALLRERRTAFIAAAVTGKLDVQGAGRTIPIVTD